MNVGLTLSLLDLMRRVSVVGKMSYFQPREGFFQLPSLS
jgi:hypothetical protein